MVGLVELTEVLLVGDQERVLRILLPRAQAFHQHVGRGLEIDDEVRRRDILCEQVIQPLINEELVVVQVQVGVDAVFFKNVVANRDLREQVGLPTVHQLAMAVEQVEQLGLQRGAGAIRVEIREEGVFGILANRRRLEAGGQSFSECGLASANRPIDRDVVEVQAAEKYIRIFMYRAPILLVLLSAAGCASAPPAPALPTLSFETKMSWILRLEDQRVLRDENAPVAPPPLTAGKKTPPVPALPPPPDLIR